MNEQTPQTSKQKNPNKQKKKLIFVKNIFRK